MLNIPKARRQPWTDSSIVLNWLRKPPHSITEVFVRNRISNIPESLPESLWKHVPFKQNPADLASRGTSVPELTSSMLWWLGPAWLSFPEDSWPSAKATPLPRELPGVVATVLTTTLVPVEEWWLWTNYSSYNTLLRILCWIQRFIRNSKHDSASITSPVLTSEELSDSRRFLILLQQKQSFPKVLEWLRKKTIPGSHCLGGMVIYMTNTP